MYRCHHYHHLIKSRTHIVSKCLLLTGPSTYYLVLEIDNSRRKVASIRLPGTPPGRLQGQSKVPFWERLAGNRWISPTGLEQTYPEVKLQ